MKAKHSSCRVATVREVYVALRTTERAPRNQFMFGAMMRLMLIVLLGLAACDDGGSVAIDAGLDAQRRLALTVEGTGSVVATRSIKVEITSNGTTRMDSFPVGGLPATVDLPAPIQLADWEIEVDGFDMNGQLIGRGTSTVPSGTSATTVTLAPL